MEYGIGYKLKKKKKTYINIGEQTKIHKGNHRKNKKQTKHKENI